MRKILKNLYNFTGRYYWARKLEFTMHLIRRLDDRRNLYFSKCGNFGDELNEDLMRYFKIRFKHARPLGADLCCIGSNLQEFVNESSKPVSSAHTVSVLGSGFISEAHSKENFMFSMKFYALRGSLSKLRCERATGKLLPNVVLGDPGLLIRRIYPHLRLSGKYDIGIICHMVDKDSELLRNINLGNSTVLFIDIEQEPARFVEQVAQCGFILSSAMHGLICADSLGIPNKHIILSNKVVGGEYKFRDYYSVFPSFKYNPIYLKDSTITARDVKGFKAEYTITSDEVNKICDNLQTAFSRFQQGNESA